MTNVKEAIAACAGAIALACAVVQPARAADVPVSPQYRSGPIEQEEGYVYRQPPPAYRYVPAPPDVYYEPAPPAVVVVPEPYYVPRRRVYIDPGYGAYGYGYRYRPHIAGGYAYHRGGWGHGPRRW